MAKRLCRPALQLGKGGHRIAPGSQPGLCLGLKGGVRGCDPQWKPCPFMPTPSAWVRPRPAGPRALCPGRGLPHLHLCPYCQHLRNPKKEWVLWWQLKEIWKIRILLNILLNMLKYILIYSKQYKHILFNIILNKYYIYIFFFIQYNALF